MDWNRAMDEISDFDIDGYMDADPVDGMSAADDVFGAADGDAGQLFDGPTASAAGPGGDAASLFGDDSPALPAGDFDLDDYDDVADPGPGTSADIDFVFDGFGDEPARLPADLARTGSAEAGHADVVAMPAPVAASPEIASWDERGLQVAFLEQGRCPRCGGRPVRCTVVEEVNDIGTVVRIEGRCRCRKGHRFSHEVMKKGMEFLPYISDGPLRPDAPPDLRMAADANPTAAANPM